VTTVGAGPAAATVVALRGTAISTATPQNLQVLQYQTATGWTPTSLATGASVTIGTTPPASPTVGALWWDSGTETGGNQLYIYYQNPSAGALQWVPAANQNASGTGPALGNVGRNLLHNPLFTVQQRGLGSWSTNGSYTADRWMLTMATPDTNTVSVQSLADTDRTQIGDEAAVYSLADAFTGATNGLSLLCQRIESLKRLSGKTITVSFWARITAGTMANGIGVGYTQFFGTGGTTPPPNNSVTGNIGKTPALTTTWTRYTMTATLPTTNGLQLGTTAGTDYTQIEFWFSCGNATYNTQSGNIGVSASATVWLWGVQLEIGSVVTRVEKLDEAINRTNCHRFYQAGNIGYWGAVAVAGQTIGHTVPWRVAMRVSPAVNIANQSYYQCQNLAGSWGVVDVAWQATQTGATLPNSAAFSGTYTASADL
jgi:hypothetical protein